MSTSTLACLLASALLSVPHTPRLTEYDNVNPAPPPKARKNPSSKGVSFQERQRLEREVSDAIARLDLPTLDLPPGAAQAGPLVCKEPECDFGTFWASGTISHTFLLENISDVAIEVYPIVACACPGGPKYTIPPRGTLELPISLRSEALHDRFTKTIRVRIVKVGEPLRIGQLPEVRAASWFWSTVKPTLSSLAGNAWQTLRGAVASPPETNTRPRHGSQRISHAQRLTQQSEVADAIERLNLPVLDLPTGAAQIGPIVCLNPTHDFGVVWARGAVVHAFELQNVSDVPIEISASTSAFSMGSFVIEPHGTLQLPCSVNIQALTGRFTKTVRVSVTGVDVPPEPARSVIPPARKRQTEAP